MINPNIVLKDESIDQIGIVVRDARAVAEQLHSLLGIGPFRMLEWPIEGIDPESTFHGQPARYSAFLAFARVGALQLELVEPRAGRSIWSDFLAAHGPGLHHLRVTISNFEETVNAWQAAGLENLASGTGVHVGSKWVYFDTGNLLDGIVLELRKRMDDATGEGQWATEGILIGAARQEHIQKKKSIERQ